MAGLNSIMDTGLSGLFLARLGLQTASHNIANVNTPGFSRQDVLASARQPMLLSYGSLGRGTAIEDVRRLTDEFLVANQRDQSARLAGYERSDAALGEIEAIFGSTSNDHLGGALNAFFNAWSDLATPPYDDSLKQAVVGAAQTLASDLRTTAGALQEAQRRADDLLAQDVTSLNGLLQQFADVNGQISAAELGGHPANDLRDHREALLLEISKLTRVSTRAREDGSLDLILKGRTVVTRGEATTLVLERTVTAGGERARILAGPRGQPLELDEGEMQGLIAARNGQIGGALAQLDALARDLIERVNALHEQGRAAGASGIAFFTGDSAATIDLNPALAADSHLVAASRSGNAGDNDLAQAIADLGSLPVDGADGPSLRDRYNGLIADLATRRNGSQFLLESQQNVVDALTSRLESVRGVSLDEEGADLVRYQNAYEAAARVVSVTSGLMETLLEMVGTL